MIIDGVEVLYTMRNGKIVDPNIPTDGLVCYLDARGKYNTDVYRNTLLDLSGNGNHGTLQNFSFTEESGYVKDLSGGGTSGLSFDGVDDKLTISRDFMFRKKPFTYFIDFEIPKTAMEQNINIDLGLGFYLHRANDKIYNTLTNNSSGNTQGSVAVTVGRHILVCSMGEDFTKSKYFLDGNSIPILNTLLSDGTPVSFIDKPGDMAIISSGTKEINKLMIWNRQLTDEEITKLMEV